MLYLRVNYVHRAPCLVIIASFWSGGCGCRTLHIACLQQTITRSKLTAANPTHPARLFGTSSGMPCGPATTGCVRSPTTMMYRSLVQLRFLCQHSYPVASRCHAALPRPGSSTARANVISFGLSQLFNPGRSTAFIWNPLLKKDLRKKLKEVPQPHCDPCRRRASPQPQYIPLPNHNLICVLSAVA